MSSIAAWHSARTTLGTSLGGRHLRVTSLLIRRDTPSGPPPGAQATSRARWSTLPPRPWPSTGFGGPAPRAASASTACRTAKRQRGGLPPNQEEPSTTWSVAQVRAAPRKARSRLRQVVPGARGATCWQLLSDPSWPNVNYRNSYEDGWGVDSAVPQRSESRPYKPMVRKFPK